MRKKAVEKVLDVDASMQGSLVFKDPVNLRINGKFDGTLNTRGNLTIGENAAIKASIIGENVIVAGEVTGDISAKTSLKIIPPARVIGNVETPTLNIVEGAVLQGNCQMITGIKSTAKNRDYLSTDEVAIYLDIEPSLVLKWVNNGRLPGVKDKDTWRFERTKIDQWVVNEKIK